MGKGFSPESMAIPKPCLNPIDNFGQASPLKTANPRRYWAKLLIILDKLAANPMVKLPISMAKQPISRSKLVYWLENSLFP